MRGDRLSNEQMRRPVGAGPTGRLATSELVCVSLAVLVLLVELSPGVAAIDFKNMFGKKQEMKSIESALGQSPANGKAKAGEAPSTKQDERLIEELNQIDKSAKQTTWRRPNVAKLQQQVRAAGAQSYESDSGPPSPASPGLAKRANWRDYYGDESEDEDDYDSAGSSVAEYEDEYYSDRGSPGRQQSSRPNPLRPAAPKRPTRGRKEDKKSSGNSRRDARRNRLQQAENEWEGDEEEEDESEAHLRINNVKPTGLAAKFKKRKDQVEAQRKYMSTEPQSEEAIDKFQLKPTLQQRHLKAANDERQSRAKSKSSIFSTKYLKKKMEQGYEKVLKPAAAAIAELPSYVREATDSISAMLQLDSRGRLLALIQEVETDIKFVKREFSKFTMVWSPIMEKGLNYLGTRDLDKIKWKSNDELDFRRDALHSLAFGYEFARLMVNWRENLLTACEAYKLYLETIKRDLLEQSKSSGGGGGAQQAAAAPRLQVNDDFIFQVKTIYAYMLLTAWMTIGELNLEPRMKLDHLMEVEDDQPKNYESEYFRNIVTLQELYEPTVSEFDDEEKQVVNAVGRAGALTEDFEDVDKFFDDFRSALAKNEVKGVDWRVPRELTDKLDTLSAGLQYNQLVYSKSFLVELREARRQAQEEP